MADRLWVVGDGFPTPRLHPEIHTYRDVVHALRVGELREGHLVPALGVAPGDWKYLGQVVEKAGRDRTVFLDAPPPAPLPRAAVLKAIQENVVLARPRVEGTTVECELVVADGNEIMHDHTAERQHLPGMLLIEAAIQATTWATRTLYPAGPERPLPYPVMHACAFDFERFLFWLPVTLRLTLTRDGEPSAERQPMRSEVSYLQQGRVAATGHFAFQAFDPPTIHAIEQRQARRVVEGAQSGSPTAPR
ncbi:AfsA-related hotdog domain-containing protein [Nocardiopsis sp. SBT366]|uniref:AfsA-related hotdog domain-containing protein n=1 Tax=Nocardiopsis sp. SBT366 TaxID=1580529 RepID=UPI00066A8ED4|nr:AfsA-related hotdog domain-containing protein [Nocardiopsis sp. SBT366]